MHRYLSRRRHSQGKLPQLSHRHLNSHPHQGAEMWPLWAVRPPATVNNTQRVSETLYSEHHRMQSHKYLRYSKSSLYMLQILLIQMHKVSMHWISEHGPRVSNMYKLCAVSGLKLKVICAEIFLRLYILLRQKCNFTITWHGAYLCLERQTIQLLKRP